MLAVCPISRRPALRNGGANGGCVVLHVAEQREHAFLAAPGAGDVDVGRAGFLECQPDEFAASLDRRPVIELVTHGCSPSR